MHRLTLALVLVAALPVPALAQDVSTAGPDLKRRDVSGLFGWSHDDRSNRAEFYDPWFNAIAGAASGGFYWTEHLKMELDVAATRVAGKNGKGEFLTVPGPPITSTSRYVDWTVQTTSVSLLQTWQFFHNVRVHPFAGLGAEVRRERWRGETDEAVTERQIVGNVVRDVLVRQAHVVKGPETRVVTTGVVVFGFKGYFNQRAFLRTDARVSIPFDRFVWRFGVGVDF